MGAFLKYLVIFLNLFGFIIGLVNYYPQLEKTNPLLWILVIDCPLAALMFALYLFGFGNEYFEALARAYAFKYGLWTIIVTISSPVLLLYTYAPVNILMHAGLLVQSFLFIRRRLVLKHFIPALLLFLINDFSDYILKTHPVINTDFLFITGFFTLILSFITPIVLYKLINKRILIT